MSRRWVEIGVVVLTLGCWTVLLWGQKVEVDYDPSFDFSRLRTFAWDPAIPAPPTFSHVDANQVDSQVRQAVEKRLRERGFHQVVTKPNFLVSYQVFGKRAEEGSPAVKPPPSEQSWQPSFQDLKGADGRGEGVLILSALDPETRRIVWQARGADVIQGPKKLAKQIDSGVQKMISKFPRR